MPIYSELSKSIIISQTMYATLSRLAKAYTFKGHEMSEELQNDEYVEETEVEAIQTEETNESESSDLATDSDGEHEEKPDDEAIAKEKRDTATNEAFNKQHRKFQDEKRRADELEQRLTKFEASQSTPSVLEKPDPFSDNYDAQHDAYIESIRQAERFEFQQSQQKTFNEQQQATQQQARQQVLDKKGTEFGLRAKESGISESELTMAVQTVVGSGMNGDVGEYILDMPEGPSITRYLAKNFEEMEKINSMQPIQAAMYIEQTVKAKVAAPKPKTTNAPSPATKVTGGGSKINQLEQDYLAGGEFS